MDELENKNGFTVIPDFVLDMGLDVHEAIVFSIIWLHSQDGDSTFRGSRKYLAKKAMCSVRKVTRIFARLISMKLIERVGPSEAVPEYKGTYSFEKGGQNVQGYSQNVQGGGQNVQGGIAILSRGVDKMSRGPKGLTCDESKSCEEKSESESCENGGKSTTLYNNISNIYNNIYNNTITEIEKEKDINNTEKEIEEKREKEEKEKESASQKPLRPRFIKPTIEEIREYCSGRKNEVDASSFYDFYESKGWMVGKNPMRDWKAAVRTWERRDRYGSFSGSQKSSGKDGVSWFNNSSVEEYDDLL